MTTTGATPTKKRSGITALHHQKSSQSNSLQKVASVRLNVDTMMKITFGAPGILISARTRTVMRNGPTVPLMTCTPGKAKNARRRLLLVQHPGWRLGLLFTNCQSWGSPELGD